MPCETLALWVELNFRMNTNSVGFIQLCSNHRPIHTRGTTSHALKILQLFSIKLIGNVYTDFHKQDLKLNQV